MSSIAIVLLLARLIGPRGRSAALVALAVTAGLGTATLGLARDYAAPALTGDQAAAGQMLEEPPRYGVYYDSPEPSFYTGFAPRTFESARLHIHLGRGNQLRVTVVLSDDVLHEYARDLATRHHTYRRLIDGGQLVLTQDRAFEDFERGLADVELERLVAEEKGLTADALRERNLALLERLNPGRVFRVRMPVTTVVRRWVAALRPTDRLHIDGDRRLEIVNLMLPTRLWVSELEPGIARAVDDLVRRAPERLDEPHALDDLAPAFVALLARVSGGIYPARDGALTFDEFTAIYPVGTFNQYTTVHGRQIPEYPTPGRRAFTTHQRTKTVDHVPTDESYAYSPWLPYMHVGTTMHNSIHTPWWKMSVADTSFLPPPWRSVDRGSRDGAPYRHLWLLSRGPMSHGCTHLNVGHIAELRQILPSETEQLYAVDVFLSKSQLYDVFDIDGDLEPEVMGVRYFIAYSLKNERPDRLRVRNERHAYYDWLYGGELEYDAQNRGLFRSVRASRFVGRTAVDGAAYGPIALREADYQPETVQFYRRVDLGFTLELRKIGLRHPFQDRPLLRNVRGTPRTRILCLCGAHVDGIETRTDS